MNKEDFLKSDFINTKWDARDWSAEMKCKWQERMSEIGFYHPNTEVSLTLDGFDYYYIHDNYQITKGKRLDTFEHHPHQEMFYSEALKTITEQGQKHDSDKPRYELLPPVAIDEMAKVMTFGAEKYAPDNWRHVDNAVERYRAALLRHSFAMLRGEKIDPETGLPHAAHAMCCAAFLVEVDD